MMQVELAYQLECELKKKDLSPAQYSLESNISLKTLLRILDKKEISLFELSNVCDALQISFESLRNPKLDYPMTFMVNRLCALSKDIEASNDNGYMAEFINSMGELCKEDIFRNTAWLSYYNDLLMQKK